MENERKVSRGDVEHYDLEILFRRPSLRANIPRRVSQMTVEYSEDTKCGFGCVRGHWLQTFANRNSYLFIYSVLGSLYGGYYAYFYSVVTTLEKRFRMSSQTVGVIACTSGVTQIIMYFILSTFIHKTLKPRMVGLGVFFMVLSTVLFSIPHFMHISDCVEAVTKMCVENVRTCEKNNKEAFVILVVAQILLGIGGSLYFIAGESYKDENTEKRKPAALLGFLSVINVLGPAFGYWMSSISLKFDQYPGTSAATTDSEPRWIGAWWLGNLVIGFILIILGILVFLFPKTLPKAAIRRLQDHFDGATHTKKKRNVLKNFLLNPKFSTTHFALFPNVLGFIPYFLYLPKYAEIQYRVPASNANLIVGSITLVSSGLGIVLANSVITRYRPSVKILASWTVIVGVLSLGGLIFYINLDCPDNDINLILNQELHSSCDVPFFPICINQTESYLSPYHAGCGNTSKGVDYCNNTNVLRGFCPVDCHLEFNKFVVSTCIITILYASGRTSLYWFETEFEGKFKIFKSVATFLGLLTFIPVPVVFGHILDESCILWEENCTKQGNCWLYDNEILRYFMNVTGIGFAVIGIIFDVGMWYSVKSKILFDDIDYNEDDTE